MHDDGGASEAALNNVRLMDVAVFHPTPTLDGVFETNVSNIEPLKPIFIHYIGGWLKVQLQNYFIFSFTFPLKPKNHPLSPRNTCMENSSEGSEE